MSQFDVFFGRAQPDIAARNGGAQHQPRHRQFRSLSLLFAQRRFQSRFILAPQIEVIAKYRRIDVRAGERLAAVRTVKIGFGKAALMEFDAGADAGQHLGRLKIGYRFRLGQARRRGVQAWAVFERGFDQPVQFGVVKISPPLRSRPFPDDFFGLSIAFQCLTQAGHVQQFGSGSIFRKQCAAIQQQSSRQQGYFVKPDHGYGSSIKSSKAACRLSSLGSAAGFGPTG